MPQSWILVCPRYVDPRHFRDRGLVWEAHAPILDQAAVCFQVAQEVAGAISEIERCAPGSGQVPVANCVEAASFDQLY